MSLSLLFTVLPQDSGCRWREMDFSSSVPPAGEAEYSLTTLSFSQGIGSCSLQCHLREWVLALAKFLFLSPMHQNSYSLLFQQCARIFPCEGVASTKSLSSVVFCSSQYSSQVSSHSLEGSRQVCWLSLFLQPTLRAVCLLSDAQMGESPPKSVGMQCWIPSSHRGTSVYGWMSN